MKCVKCNCILKKYLMSFDFAFSILGPELMYCENKKCELFGIITVAGIPEDEKEKEEKI